MVIKYFAKEWDKKDNEWSSTDISYNLFDFNDLIEEFDILKKEITHLTEKVNKLEDEKVLVVHRVLPLKEAENKIKEFISQKKSLGIKKIDDFEIMEKLRIPIEEIDEVLEKLEKKGIVNEQR